MPSSAVPISVRHSDIDISSILVPDIEQIDDGARKDGIPTLGHGHPDEDETDDDDDMNIIAAQQLIANRKSSNADAKQSKKSGAFQSFGLNSALLKSITKKGFSVPTPIQRKTIPLILDNQDVVGMARTGSGKTAAFVIPMIEKLKSHSVQVGARAIIMSPSRELALQTLKATKEFGRGTDLRCVLLVGGDSLEDQFGHMTSNPDIIIATPGRFMHLLVEMSLDISSVRYVVFDEADRLFEMGFSVQLTELLHALPVSRQTLLFSATLPKSLVEFAKAGLREPRLVRLDAESKISPDLQNAFLNLKKGEKEGALLHLLQDVIGMPLAASKNGHDTADSSVNKKKRKRSSTAAPTDVPTPQSTIIFVATKHHVEYLTTLLGALGFPVSYVYGSLDQTARKSQIDNFRAGTTTILVVTDVAARGIDMPMLANVINYDFPSQPKVFVHRVGRTARAGQKGWSYSLLQDSDLPYLIDLQLFLGRRLVVGRSPSAKMNFADDMALGSIPRKKLEITCETMASVVDQNEDLMNLREVARKGEKQYTRTRNSASTESAKRAKRLSQDDRLQQVNMLYKDDSDSQEAEKEQMLARISGFRPSETIFEIGKRGKDVDISRAMRKRKEKLHMLQSSTTEAAANSDMSAENASRLTSAHKSNGSGPDAENTHLDFDSDDDFEVTFPEEPSQLEANSGDEWQDQDHFISYEPKSVNFAEDRGYGVNSGSYNSNRDSNFASAANSAVMDITNDESKSFALASKPRQLRWDKRSKKYVSTANDFDGSKGPRMINSESGQKIAATFRSGRFAAWKKSNQIDRLPNTGEIEASPQNNTRGGRSYKHYAARAPKAPDKYRDDYHKKKKRLEESQKVLASSGKPTARPELKGVDDVRKQRMLKEKRRLKNARPARKRKL